MAGSLEKALRADSPLSDCLRLGKRALEGNRTRVVAQPPRLVTDSVDVDTFLEAEHPNEARWDYLLGLDHKVKIIAVEVHPATDREVSRVVAKKTWTQAELKKHLKSRSLVSKWFWVSSGTTGFTRTGMAQRRLNAAGIVAVGRALRLPERL